MENNNVKNIIKSYLAGCFSKATNNKFAWWMLNSSGKQERDMAMEEIFNESCSATNDNLLSDLHRLRQAMGTGTKPKSKIAGTLLKTAAAVMLFVSGVTLSYYYMEQHYIDKLEGCEFVQTTVPEGETRQVVLSDGTKVTVNASSLLIYPKKFMQDTRTVFLTGEADFTVAKDAKHPFIVKTQYLSVRALGTKFNVNAYPSDAKVLATLEEGKVRVSVNSKYGNETPNRYILMPNEGLEYDKMSGKVAIKKVNAPVASSWSKGYMVFSSADFDQIKTTLQRRYGVRVVCNDISRIDGSYHLKFRPDETLEDVMNLLKKLSSDKIDYKLTADTVYIYAK